MLLDVESQESIVKQYKKCSTKEAEDIFLSTCMKYEYPKLQKTGGGRQRSKVWTFTVRYDHSIDVILCKKCFQQLFQVRETILEKGAIKLNVKHLPL